MMGLSIKHKNDRMYDVHEIRLCYFKCLLTSIIQKTSFKLQNKQNPENNVIYITGYTCNTFSMTT